MRCPSCQASVADDDRFCAYCGLNLQRTRPGSSSASASSVSTPDLARAATPPYAGDTDTRATPSRPAMGPELTSCPRCGAGNSPQRALCGRCGADLQSGDLPPRAATPAPAGTPEHAPSGPAARPGRRRSRAGIALVLVLGGVVGSAVGVVLWLRFRPGDAEQAAPTFDPGVYSTDPVELPVAGASASSTLDPRGTIRYDAGLVIDGEPSTAWNEGAEGLGEGAILRLRLADPSWVGQVSFRNGYQKDTETFRDNARAERLLLRLGDGSTFEVALHDRSGEQVVLLPEPVLASSVTLEVLAAVPGEQYADLAISEVTPIGWVARGVDRVPTPETLGS